MNNKLLLILALLIVPCVLSVAPIEAQADETENDTKIYNRKWNGTIMLPNASMNVFGSHVYYSIAETHYTWEYATVDLSISIETNTSITIDAFEQLYSEDYGGYFVPINSWNISDTIDLDTNKLGLDDWVSNGYYRNSTTWENNGTHRITERYQRHGVSSPYVIFLIHNFANITGEVYVEGECGITLHGIGPALAPDVEIVPILNYYNSPPVNVPPPYAIPIPFQETNTAEQTIAFYNMLFGSAILLCGALLGGGWVFLSSRKTINNKT